MKILNARRGLGNVVEGEVLASSQAVHFNIDVDQGTGICIRSGHPLEGQCLHDKIVVFSYGKGGITNDIGLSAMASRGTAPKGIIVAAAKPDLVHGAINAGISLMEGLETDPVQCLKSGDYVVMDPASLTIKVFAQKPASSDLGAMAGAPKAPKMPLTPEEERFLSGAEGEAAKWAMNFIAQEGNYWQASGTAPLLSVHLGACISHMGHSDWGIHFVEQLAKQGAKFRVLTTTTPVGVDYENWEDLGMGREAMEKQVAFTRILARMGAVTIDTTSPYLLGNVPRAGDHVVWGESNEAVMANAYFGARGNLVSYLLIIAHAIIGRVPRFGFALDENRRGNVLVEVRASLKHETDWDALGYAVVRALKRYDAVPVFVDLPVGEANLSTLKRLSCTISTVNPFGSLSMFHVVGVTPEAPTVEAACGGTLPTEKLVIEQKDIDSVYQSYDYKGKVDNIYLGDSNSPQELKKIAVLLNGRKVAKSVRVWVFTDPAWKPVAKNMGVLAELEEAGCKIVAGVFPSAFGGTKIREYLENSVVLCDHAAPAYWFTGSVSWMGRMNVTPVFRPLATCIEAAVNGIVE